MLGDEKTFNTQFRHPIERQDDPLRRMLLNRRIKPFLLRRTKDNVAKELPPKTEMVRKVELTARLNVVYQKDDKPESATVNFNWQQTAQRTDFLGRPRTALRQRPLVSIDYRTDPRSSIIDALSTMVINGTQVKIYAWYDNEWAYANRTVELARLVGLAV